MNDYTNYWNTNVNDKVVYYGKKILDYSLKGFESKDVLVDGVAKKLLIRDKYSENEGATKRTVIGQIDDFKCGSVVEYKDNKWIVITYVLSDHEIYDKGVIEICNNTLVIETDPIQTLTGYDPMGRPIYVETPSTPLEIPCITTTSIKDYEKGVGTNLPDGILQITIPYLEHEKLAINTNFNMYNGNYKIVGLNYSDVINQNGIIKITAERF